MNGIISIFKHELRLVFSTMHIFVFLAMYVIFSNVFMYFYDNFFSYNEASLRVFFKYQPWILLVFIPAITMKVWSENYKLNTIELLFTLPIKPIEIIIGKFLSSWMILALVLFLTFPVFIMINVLGEPDNSVILLSYLGVFLMGGLFIAIGLSCSSTTNSQALAFIITTAILFFYIMCGTDFVTDFTNGILASSGDFISTLSVINHFEDYSKGLLTLNSVLYFVFSIVFWLSVNYLIVSYKRSK